MSISFLDQPEETRKVEENVFLLAGLSKSPNKTETHCSDVVHFFQLIVPRLGLDFLQSERLPKAQGDPSVSVLSASPSGPLKWYGFVPVLCWGLLLTPPLGRIETESP